MKYTKSIIIGLIIVLGLLCLNINEANAWPRNRFYTGPVVTVSKPGHNYIWIEGHWKINKFGKTVWVPGRWKRI